MANLVAKLLAIFPAIIVVQIACSQADAKIIPLGSRLYPQNTSSWLSASGIFTFGFYKKANGFAVGIWLQPAANSEPQITWTANRDDPPISPEAYLEFSRDGKVLLYTEVSVLDVFNLTIPATSFSLLDSGNLRAYNGSKVIWQSFDHPTDTILGGQIVQLGYNLYASVSASDHSRGRFLLAFQGDGNLVAYPVNVTPAPAYAYWSTSTVGITSGREQLVLNERGQLYLNLSSMDNQIDMVHNITQSSFLQSANNDTIYRATFDPDGNFRLYLHLFNSRGDSKSRILWSALQNECEVRGYCGVNSYCSFDASTASETGDKCFCFPGFIYFDPGRKFLGCYRNFTYERFCGREEFSEPIVQKNMSIGGYPYASTDMPQEECGQSCMNDCNCWTALYNGGICDKFRPPFQFSTQGRNQSGIAFIKQSRNVTESIGENDFLHQKSNKEGRRKRKMILILVPPFGFLSVLFTVLAVFSFSLYRRRALKYQNLLNMENLGINKEFTLRSFSYSELEKATDGFRRELGNISYGKIYEGFISEGNRKVAVNRLEKVDDEGEREFIAEITAMGRIYHKNVVQLVGFCLEGAKRLLVYEFMTNRSLADILYDVERRPLWKQRIKIALDVARGIQYLHEECDTRIIHCKIKPKNILVDDNLTAKLSSFGFAKLLTPCKTEKHSLDREKRGYSAPEWRKNDLISEKVDVYSFGVSLLEIICCTGDEEINVQNMGGETFPSKVYRCFKSKDFRKLIGDEDQVDVASLERFIKVGLCCVQEDSDLRPSIKNVILMLEGTLDTPIPLPPTLPVNVSS